MGRGASTNSIPEIENARFLFVIGSNTTEAHPVLALRIKKAVRNGGTLVVADPRKIWLTKLAKRHLQLRPGTDVWLLNAMMHTILAEGLQDEEYIRELTEDFDAVREVVARYSPEDAEKVTGVPADDIRATAREYASERHAAIFYTLGITEHACGVDNIWSLSNLVLMTGHLGYESTGLNALRGQNNVQGLNDSGANPSYLPGYQPVDDPEIWQKFSEAWGVEVPEAHRLPARPDDERAPRRPREGDVPDRREPGADRAERAPRRGGARQARVPDLAGHLPARHDPQVRGRRLPGVVVRREGRHVHEHRAAHQPRARGGAASRATRRATARSSSSWRRRWARTGRSTRTPSRSGTSSPTSPPTGTASATTGIEENGVQWPVPEIGGPGTPFLHAPAPARAGGQGKFFPVEYQRPIEEPDSEYPLVLSTGRTLYHYNSATMTMRESGITDKQEEPFFEISAEDASALGLAEGDWARLVSRRGDARGAGAHLGPRVPGPRLDGAPLRRAEGQLAHARRRRLADRHARVQGQRRARRARRLTTRA